jgi:ubiquinone/menaquinone biosynthesis C-methylase UbiE
MNLLKTTEFHKNWWANRKADWDKSYLQTADHPHRRIIVDILKEFPWLSLIEIGCNAGPNLVAILRSIPGRQIGGVDVNPEAIALAEKTFKGGMFKVGSADNIMMSDKSTDVILSDMTLIYVGPRKIQAYIDEIKRVARNYVVLCEFHSEKWWNRVALKINSGYNAYDWRKKLKNNGFYDMMEYKITEKDWPGGNPQKTFAYIFIAKVPKK